VLAAVVWQMTVPALAALALHCHEVEAGVPAHDHVGAAEPHHGDPAPHDHAAVTPHAHPAQRDTLRPAPHCDLPAAMLTALMGPVGLLRDAPAIAEPGAAGEAVVSGVAAILDFAPPLASPPPRV
jgi:hypothetical protein